MSELDEMTPKLEFPEFIFKDVKFFISGDIHEKIVDLLKRGGAERLNYISDYVTHLIIGENAEENDIADANDVYEIPALTAKWVLMCASLKRLVSVKPYLYIPGGKLFSNVLFCISGLKEDLNTLWALITYYGGTVQLNLNNKCQYLVTTTTEGQKYHRAECLGPEVIKIVTPDWIFETVRQNCFVDPTLFHPKLIDWPKPLKTESTTAITGFEPEQIEFEEQPVEKSVSDSTQALLDKLKQRMPWNQPSQPTKGETLAPPNVVAPSFAQKQALQMNQNIRAPSQQAMVSQQLAHQSSTDSSGFSQMSKLTSTSSPQIPRGLVHHTPNQQQQQQQQQQEQMLQFQQTQNNMNINRLMGQPQTRPNLQNLKGQLGQNQLHQQLMHQRGPQPQDPIQRASIQQQLLQQQFNQSQLGQSQHNQGQILAQANANQQQQMVTNQQQMSQLQQQQQFHLKQNQQQQQQQQIRNPQQSQQQQLINQQQQQQLSNQQQQIQQQLVKQQQQQQQVPNQQQQQILNQQQVSQQQHIPIPQQIPNQQVQTGQPQKQMLSQGQQLQLNQNQHVQQLIQNQQFQQNQVQLNQNPQDILNQQILQNQLLHPGKTVNQPPQQQPQPQPQIGQGTQRPNFPQSNINQHLLQRNNQQQQMLQQKHFLNQQQQQQLIQNQQNLGMQQQFINTNFNQDQNVNPQLNVQALNQQLSTQNLGQQLNQQQLNQHLNQQGHLNPPPNQPEHLGQQQINPQNQLNPVNPQLSMPQQQINRQNLQQQQPVPNQQSLHQLNQVVHTPFQQQSKLGQQILINQGAQQAGQPQRPLWSQQPGAQVPGQQIIRHPVSVVQQGARLQWSPNSQQGNVVPQRQFIQLDARTHNELQKMTPEQQAMFVAKLRNRQLPQRGSHILIRGNVPSGLTTQQQVQWLQQQAKQQGIVLPPNIQQQNITPGTLTQQPNVQQHSAPGLSPINQNNPQYPADQSQQLQLKQYRLHQLQLQREQAQKNHLAQQQGSLPQPVQAPIRPIGQPAMADSAVNPPQAQDGNIQHSLVVNAKTKTALANMLSIKLQSGGSSVGAQRPEAIQEPSAAGTLRLMTAQHNAALNPKSQEIIALQRRAISGPNGELIKPISGAQPPPIIPPNDALKLQYCTKPSLPLQHRPGPFYGHNPNLKLPPDLFLLGCIFVVVEIENFLEERIPGWQQKIEKHGGEVEKQYCSRVTHVLCETQRHGVVMQALRDCKRCVTILWLSDVIQRKQVLPPWTALHLPNLYLDTTPASKHLISITGFEGIERNRIKQMIKYTGAKCTTYLSKHNTLLLSAKAEGKKCTYAKKWQVPVVNVQWLTDIMLGHFAAMNQMDYQIYQSFSTPPNFSFDPKLVPNLMVAWKAPINISQDSYERVKRSASPVILPKKNKKQKTEPTDENDNINEEAISNASHKILFSMVTETKEMEKMVRELGGAVALDHLDFTHLVMPYLARSNKLFFAIAKSAHIISDQWLKDSHKAQQFLSESDYTLNPKEFNQEYNCDYEKTIQEKNRDKLLEGKCFYLTPSVFPSKKILTELIQSCGGTVERVRRSATQIEATNANAPYTYFIVTHENDLHLVADLLKNKKDKMRIICNAELIFSAILKQVFEVEPYAVCVL